MDVPRNSKDVANLFDSYLQSSNQTTSSTILKGHVIAHYRASGNPGLIKFLRSSCGDQWTDSLKKPVLAAVSKWNTQLKRYSSNLHQESSAISLVDLLGQGYALPVQRKRLHSDGNSSASDSTPSTPSSVCSLASIDSPTSSPACDTEWPTPKRFKSCPDCVVLRRDKSTLQKQLLKIKHVNQTLESKSNINYSNERRVLKQSVKRLKKYREKVRVADKKMREAEKKVKLANDKVEPLKTKIKYLQEQIRKLKDQKAHTKRYHSSKNSDSAWSQKLQAAQLEIKSLKEKLSGAENRVFELEESQGDSIKTMDGKQYDEKTRICINYCLEKNVSHQNASDLVNFIVNEMTGKTLEKLPAPSTNANIQREFGIISDIQCGAIMSESSNVTLAWDGTTKDGVHYNEKHVVTASGSLTLGVSEMPGGKAIDYRRDLRNSLTDITNRYSQCFDTDPAETSKKIHDGKKVYYNVKK